MFHLLQKLEEVRTSLKDIYKKLERKCISECSIGEIGTVSADAFTSFAKDARQKSVVDQAYSEISLLAEKSGDLQGMLSIIENAHVLLFYFITFISIFSLKYFIMKYLLFSNYYYLFLFYDIYKQLFCC